MGLLSWLGSTNEFKAEDKKLEHGGQLYGQAAVRGEQAGQRQAPGVLAAQTDKTQIDKAAQEQVRNKELALSDALAQRAMGTGGPSAAETQLRTSTDRGLRQAQALQASQKGAVSPMAAKNLQATQALTQQEAAGQGAALRAQEQMAAQQSLGGLLGQTRGADIGLATSQAGLTQQANLANAGFQQQANLADQAAKLQQQQISDAAQLGWAQQQMGVDVANQAAAMNAQQINAGIAGGNAAAEAGFMGGLLGTGGSLGGAAIMASDKNAKKIVNEDDFDAEDKKRKYGQGYKEGPKKETLTEVFFPKDEFDVEDNKRIAEERLKKEQEKQKSERVRQLWADALINSGKSFDAVGASLVGASDKYVTSDKNTKNVIERPEELSRERKPVRPEELSRARKETPIERKEELTRARKDNKAYEGKALDTPKFTSDREAKKDASFARKESDALLAALEPVAFEYKNPELHGEGKRLGIMAQDMERGGMLGKEIVTEDATGTKVLDVNKALSAALAMSARLGERVDDLETMLATRRGKK